MTRRFNLDTARDKANEYLQGQTGIVEISNVKATRTSQQNKALHLFYTILSQQLNEIGLEHRYFGVTGKELSLPYTKDIIKTFIWKPIQSAMFGIESTTKLKTEQINAILDVLIKHFGEQGIEVSFPSRFEEYLKFVGGQQG